jgi:hypothetical protein
VLRECLKIRDFKKWLKDKEKSEELKKNDLISLLITPVQRVPRYTLLLEVNLFK